jgi:MinD-like ATPase involved in chromosome partitioning or flagellar assembly
MFYSYKGGTGRTVAAANVAAALAKLGRRVLIIDLDFEAPGLQYVLDVADTKPFNNGLGIQNYLRGERSVEELYTEVAIDLFAEGSLLSAFAPPDGSLSYIMASSKVKSVNSDDPQVQVLMQNLLTYFEREQQLDFVILDAASGIRDAYTIAADVSDEMLIFFRWSRQHVEGTLLIARYIKLLKDYGQNWIPFKVVASATPSQEELTKIENEALRSGLIRVITESQKKIEEALEACDIIPAKIFFDIPEILELKWRERIQVFERDDSPYEALALKLCNSI